jgi:beta-mannosidase
MNNKITQDLNSNWEFQEKDTSNWLSAKVPGCVHLDLLINNQIPDPFFGTNEKEMQWISEKDWSYRLIFYPDSKLLIRDEIVLTFHGLDTYAHVFLNNEKILESNNMFHPWTSEVKSLLHKGENELLVHFLSPINKVLPFLQSKDYILPADNDQIKKTSPYTRKAPYHYGWDWGPSFATSGIWQSVELVGQGPWSVDSCHILQDEIKSDRADLVLQMCIQSSLETEAELMVSEEKTQTNLVKSVSLSKGLNHLNQKIVIEDPELWWPVGHGDQPLYEFKIGLISKECEHRITKRVGLREARVEQKKDKNGTSFTFVINGKPIFSKGANWIPADSFTARLQKEDYRRLLQSAAAANMNTLRVWGGGIYESDEFYELCDEIGILVWQDFMFACSLYPGDKEFLDSVEIEARYQVNRLKDHPSIILWCGNNEIAWAWHNWGWKDKYPEKVFTEDYKRLFHSLLPSVCSELDPSRLYWPSSPGDSDSLPEAGQNYGAGDNHFWDVWHGGKDFSAFEDSIGRFMSEFGMQSFPDLKTVDSFCDKKDKDLESDVVKSHQKASLGNANVEKYVDMYFPKPKDFNSFVITSQIMAGEAIKNAVEAHRRAMPLCMGSLYWQLNDCWPGASWSSLDYYGNWKALHYYAVEFFSPILISVTEKEGSLCFFVVYDHSKIKKADLMVKLIGFDGSVIHGETIEFSFPVNSSAQVYEVKTSSLLKSSDPRATLLRSAILLNGKIISKTDYFFVKPKDLKLPEQKYKYTVEKEQDRHLIYIEALSFLYKLHVRCVNDSGVFSRNFFEMIPSDIVKLEYLPSNDYNKSHRLEPLEFEVNSVFGLSN